MECGFITWDSVDYFQKWQNNLLHTLGKLEDTVNETIKELKDEEDFQSWDNLEECNGDVQIQEKNDGPVLIKFINKKEAKKNNPEFVEIKTVPGKRKRKKRVLIDADLDDENAKPKKKKSEDDQDGEFVAVLKRPILRCDVCADFKTNSQKSLDRHMFEKHEQTMCSICGMNFSKFKLFYYHSLTHKDPEVCSECGQEFKTPALLKKHITQIHSNLPREMCPYCGKAFCGKASLQGHIDRIHEKNFKPFPCQHCDYIAKNKAELEYHVERRHGESNPVSCPWCGRFVKRLDKHLQRNKCNIPESEREEKPKLQCPLCPKTIGGHEPERALKRHIRSIHEQVKDIHCDQCDYKTYSKCNLYVHVKRMHEGRSYKEQCPHCPKIVVNLEFHIETYHGNLIKR